MKYKAIVLAGPTGTGKTELSINIAKKINAEIISADSMQIYKNLDIGTAKIKEEEKQNIIHHMIDIVNPDEEYSVGEYEKRVNLILNNNIKPYILVGGTGLYINAITEGISKLPEKNLKLREKLENTNLEVLLNHLKELDFSCYEKIDKKNKVRVIRALEVCLLTNSKFSEITEKNFKNNKYDFLKIFLTRDREDLYNRINYRIDKMIEDGLLDESYQIYLKYPNCKAIGYKELFEYFDNKISKQEAIDKLKQKSRNYAKRQITWFNRQKDYIIYNLTNETKEYIIEDILNKFNKMR